MNMYRIKKFISLKIAILIMLPFININPGFAQIQPTKPVPRPGMSEYQPADYSGMFSTDETTTTIQQKGPGLPGSTPSQSPVRPYNGPYTTIPGTGIKAYFNAPVPPPYNPSASYDTYAGQPGGNRSAILQQSIGGY